ncbi:succinate-semialdehyde dehydrogenase/glutarate-semialdehyde dehydrogenase [Pseudochelatococcus lubricantis]|uniref:Succinate-semialdehyde dehydrogenase/glutarate-semialdehyde dehydrogenase n=1 Tax=Pseudochelatococcus lubricantis TaxID=1538102 RepID=A0ABX0UYP5_9HYPH|nr:NAD-dependent succinate-semialdehyde dehydrogenase [Pseudochelatococcus lubricantis]NIJ58028.1 succinate-semialdehyde dehydrogenase/glutarate-semialdehyde dehydrogenase [Pseudochelatococcus lubricantis]
MYENFGLFIDGGWRSVGGEGVIEVQDPGKGTVIGSVPAAGVADVQEAIAAAGAGLQVWRSTPAWARADALHAVADRMIARAEEAERIITLETGKPLAQSRREWGLSTDQFRWYAEEARRIYGRIVESRAPGGRIEVHHEPVGIVAAFTAWNFPAVLVARKVAPALAAGCSVIVRPSSETPGSAMVIIDCIREAGIPAGVVGLVAGPTSTTYQTLVESPDVRKITLTGSTAVGQQMIRDSAETVKRLSMELGGNAPLVAFDDADFDRLLDLAVPTKYANAGQVCVSPDRFYIHESLYERFTDEFARRAAALKVGHGLDETSEMGPIINLRRLEAIEAVVADAQKRGAKLLTGGKRLQDGSGGYFFEPTVLKDVPDDAKALAEENFGPIAAITPFGSADEVYARANAGGFGLAAYVFTQSAARAREAVAGIEAGMVGVNSFALAAAEAPFGGIKLSGMGREGGSEGIHDFLNIKLSQVAF